MLLSICAMAQSQGLALTMGYGQPTMREGLGTNYTSGNMLDDETEADYGIGKTVRYKGFQAGLMYEATIIKGFGAAIHLDYTFGYNSTKWRIDETAYTGYPRYRAKMEMHCLDLAVDWQYKFEVATKTYIILYTGPTFDLNVSGKTHLFCDEERYLNYDVTLDPLSQDALDDFSWDKNGGYDDFAYSRWNVMWGVGAGFQYKRYFIRGGYDFGLITGYRNRQATVGDDLVNIKSRLDQWQIKVGIFFWQRD